MKTSRYLICVGVGVLMVGGQMGATQAQTAPDSQPKTTSVPDQSSIVDSAGAPDNRGIAVKPSPSEGNDYQMAQARLPLTIVAQPETELTFQPEVVKLSLPGLTAPPRPVLPLAPRSATSKPIKIPTLAQKRPRGLPAIAQQPAPASAPTPTNVPKLPTPLPPATSPATPSGQMVLPPDLIPTPLGSPEIPNFDPKAPAPNYLNPSPNPLNFPTKPEEVNLLGIQAISLQQAQELAARNNRALEVSKLQLEQSQFALREAQAALFPTLSLQTLLTRSQSASGGLSRQEVEQSNQRQIDTLPAAFQQLQDPGAVDPVTTSLSGTIQLNYNVFTSGQRSGQIRAAEKQVRVNELTVESQTEQLRLDVATTYYSLQNADQQVQINAAAVRNATQSLRDTVAQERAGLGTQFDVLRAQVQLANAKQQLVNSMADQKIRRRQLAQQLSLAEGIDLYAGDPVVPAGTWTLPLEDSIVLAYKNRAELEGQLVTREIAEQNRKVALSALGPTVSVSAQYDLLDVFERPVTPADGYTFTARANWTLFDGGQARARARQQEKVKEIAERNFARSREQARFEVEQAYANLQANLANIETAKAAEKDAERSLYLARLRFQAGVGTQSDVINAETDLTRAQGNRVSAIIGYNLSLAQLQRAVSNVSNPIAAK